MKEKKSDASFRPDRPWLLLLLGILDLRKWYTGWYYYQHQLLNIIGIVFTTSIFVLATFAFIDKYRSKGPIIPKFLYMLIIIIMIIALVIRIVY